MSARLQRVAQVAPRVWLVGGPDLTDPADCLVYAVDGGSAVALIDCGAGPSAPMILANLALAGLAGKPLAAVILTHCHVDHVGGLSAILARHAPSVVCHARDAAAVEGGDPVRTAARWYGVELPRVHVDRRVEGEEAGIVVGSLELRCLHAPGHTPGSLLVLLDAPGARVVFAQDVHGPFLPEFGSDRDRWAASMEMLLALRPDVLCEGHYGVFQPWPEVERFVGAQLQAHGCAREPRR